MAFVIARRSSLRLNERLKRVAYVAVLSRQQKNGPSHPLTEFPKLDFFRLGSLRKPIIYYLSCDGG